MEKEKKDRSEVDFGIGKISFGGLFKEIGNLLESVSKMGEEGFERRGEVELPKRGKVVYGFSIRTLEGKPIVETFGNVKETSKGPVVEEVREPMVDIFDEKDHILVIAELPGVSEENIKIEVSQDMLNLTASNKDRKYAKEILLPCKVKREPLKTSYKNGILEVTLGKIES
jgi:HSP20 family protein